MHRRECIGTSIVKFSHSRSTVRDLINTISLTFVATYRTRAGVISHEDELACSIKWIVRIDELTTCIVLFSLFQFTH